MRLTQHARDEILTAVITQRFLEEKAAIEARKDAMAAESYDALYSRKLQKKLEDLPRGWLLRKKGILVVTAQHGNHYFSFGKKGQPLTKPFKAVDVDRWDGGKVVLEADHPVVQKLLKIEADKKLLAEEEAKLRAETKAALARITTYKKLKDTWPEIVPFMPQEIVASLNLPAIPVKALNRKLRLKKKAA